MIGLYDFVRIDVVYNEADEWAEGQFGFITDIDIGQNEEPIYRVATADSGQEIRCSSVELVS